MDELVQLIIFIAIALVAMLGGKKKPQQRPPQRPAQRPPARRPAGAPSRRQQADASREQLKEDLLDLLQGRVPSSHRPPPPPPPPAQPDVPRVPEPVEAQSIESLDPEGSPSHQVFHERYVDLPPADTSARRSVVRRLTPRTAREAVIWKTIFDKPKGME